MQRLVPTILPLLAFASLAASVPVEPVVDYGNANIYIDLVLFNINRQLPPTIAVPNIGGPFHMNNCFLIGLEEGIHRDGDATLVAEDQTVKFAGIFQMRDIGIKCDWKFGISHGTVTTTTAKVDTSTAMTWVLKRGEHPWLTEFRVTSMEPFDVEIKGLTFAFNWLAEDISEWVLRGVQDEITYVLEHQLHDEIQSILDTMVIP